MTDDNERGVSSEVGTILMLAVTVILVAIALPGFQSLLADQSAPDTPYVVVDDQYYAEQNTTTGTVNYVMELTSQAGENVNRDDVQVRVTSGGVDKTYNLSGGPWNPGDKVSIDLSEANICSAASGDEASITLVHEPTQRALFQTDAVVNKNVSLSIDGNSVGSNTPYTADVEILGAGASATSGDDIQPDSLVARVVVLNEDGSVNRTLTPYGDGDPNDSITFPNGGLPSEADNINGPQDRVDGGTVTDDIGETYTTSVLGANQTVTLEARSIKPNGWESDAHPDAIEVTREGNTYDYVPVDLSQGAQDTRYWVDARNPSASEVEVFNASNAQSVNIGQLDSSGLPHQLKASDIMAPYIDGGTLNIDDNQAIFLFELNSQNADYNGGSGDFNDAIALIEVNPEPQVTQTDRQPEIRCG